MAVGRITKRSVDAIPLPVGTARAYLWDDTLKGFGVMVTAKGARSYLVQYQIGGRGSPTRRYTIGRHGSPWTPERARERATEVLEQVRRKIDPVEAEREVLAEGAARKEREEAGRAINSKLGFSTFADRFIRDYARINQPKSWKETQAIVNRDLKPAFGDRPLTEITEADIIEHLEQLQERAPTAALKAYKALNLLFAFAADRERRHFKPSASPMLAIKPPTKVGSRKRTLSDDELRLAWLSAGGLGWPFGPIVRLLILTGQRRDEVAGLVWPELNLDLASWVLPGERAKNGQTHYVPLSDPAVAILKDLPVIKSDEKLLFTTTGKTAVSGFSKIKARLDALMIDKLRAEAIEAGAADDEAATLAIEPWTLHDLRRTMASGCQRLGIKVEVTEAALNHVSGTRSGIVGVYQVYQYADEKRAALNAWAQHVLAIVTGKDETNVVQLAVRA